ncbi:protein phosphatase 2C domain-containing protein [Blautia obeum]|uniref:protein phosphatase 2C domain-containing protein n=1 Tax=Blautia obeum TaxID=40520 RepID=UPI003F8A3472
MQSYITLHNHHIGLSHINNHMECEDYSLSFGDDNLSVAVICDGHGDKNCFRSALGAKIGCEIAVKKARQFQQYLSKNLGCENTDFDILLHELEEDIVNLWRQSVLSDAQENPFTEEELTPLSANVQEIYRNHQRMEKAYGCTLILAVIMQDYWYALQIGDGKCVALYDDGVYVESIPADEENCVGNRSTSICGSHALEDFRHYWSQIKPLAVYVSSDGIEESFDEKGLFNFYYSITHWVQNDGKEMAEKQIEDLLPKISEGGSGDDVSIAGIVAPVPRVSPARQSLEQIETKVIAAENQLSRFSDLLANTVEESDSVKKRKAEIEQKIRELTEELTKLTEESDALAVDIEHFDTQIQELQEKKGLSEEQVNKAHKYLESARNFWKKKLLGLGLLKEQTLVAETETVQSDIKKEMDEDEEGDVPEVLLNTESSSDIESGTELGDTIVSTDEEEPSLLDKSDDSESDGYEDVEMSETIAVDDIIVPKMSSSYITDDEINHESRLLGEYPVEQNVYKYKKKQERIEEENESSRNAEKRWSIFKRFRGE